MMSQDEYLRMGARVGTNRKGVMRLGLTTCHDTLDISDGALVGAKWFNDLHCTQRLPPFSLAPSFQEHTKSSLPDGSQQSSVRQLSPPSIHRWKYH
jgi:hypothetical protein